MSIDHIYLPVFGCFYIVVMQCTLDTFVYCHAVCMSGCLSPVLRAGIFSSLDTKLIDAAFKAVSTGREVDTVVYAAIPSILKVTGYRLQVKKFSQLEDHITSVF